MERYAGYLKDDALNRDKWRLPQPRNITVSRSISEGIEDEIVARCPTFTKGKRFADLGREDKQWEVKVYRKKTPIMMVNRRTDPSNKNYIIVNYGLPFPKIHLIWVLPNAEDRFFVVPGEGTNLNWRDLNYEVAKDYIEYLYRSPELTPTPMLELIEEDSTEVFVCE